MFKTAYTEVERHYVPHGEHLEKEYGYNKHGELEETGVVDVYDKIQECAEETKIINILKRMTAGDTTMLRPDGIYEDISQIPKDFNSQMQAMKEAKAALDSLQQEPQKVTEETPAEAPAKTPAEAPAKAPAEAPAEAPVKKGESEA